MQSETWGETFFRLNPSAALIAGPIREYVRVSNSPLVEVVLRAIFPFAWGMTEGKTIEVLAAELGLREGEVLDVLSGYLGYLGGQSAEVITQLLAMADAEGVISLTFPDGSQLPLDCPALRMARSRGL